MGRRKSGRKVALVLSYAYKIGLKTWVNFLLNFFLSLVIFNQAKVVLILCLTCTTLLMGCVALFLVIFCGGIPCRQAEVCAIVTVKFTLLWGGKA